MSTETPVPPGTEELNSPENRYLEIARTPEFENLRRTFRRFVFPATLVFLVWYGLYVLLSAYARGFMDTKVVGHINVALIFGLLQFVSTFLIAWLYARYAGRSIDPIADDLRATVEADTAARSLPNPAETSVASPAESPVESSVETTVPEAGDKE